MPDARASLKDVAREIFHRTIESINVRATLERKMARSGSRIHCGDFIADLRAFDEIVAIAFGKAAFAMADGLTAALAPDFSANGILVTPTPPPHALRGWQSFVGGHPVPTAASFAAGRAILERLARCGEKTLVIFLLSGGGSALVESPLDPAISLEDFQQLHRVLVACGAPIEEINPIRKHLSATKGGRLAAAAPRATKITYGVSDVPASHESALASGPTLPDPSTVQAAEEIARRYDLAEKLPPAIRAKLQPGAMQETPKAGEAAFARAHFAMLLDMHDLFHAAHRATESAGFTSVCDNHTDNWPIEAASDFLLQRLMELAAAQPARPVAVIADGEVSSAVKGDGVGGRNSAFVLACARKITKKNVTVLSAGTDGIDGNSPAAGAVVDGETLARAHAAGMDPAAYMARSDAYNFFKQLDDTIETGPTGNNLRDLRILLLRPD